MKNTKQRNEQLSNLIALALERFSIDEITTCFIDQLDGWKDRDELTASLLSDKEIKDSLKDELENEFMQGKFVVKLETQAQQTKSNDTQKKIDIYERKTSFKSG